MIKENRLSELIGKTPLKKVRNLCIDEFSEIFMKLESHNPGGSIKDRLGLALIDDAEKNNKINPESIIIEPTSGNTGIALAMLCAEKGYKLKIVMPENMSVERMKVVEAYGSELVLIPSEKGMKGAIDKAMELNNLISNSYIPFQFMNKANPKMHYSSTGPEIWEATQGNIDILVCGVGTGGTITGCGKYLKEKNPHIKIVAVEPFASPVLSGGEKGIHKIQGIGAGFVPEVLDLSLIDEVIKVKCADAISIAKAIMKFEGISCGISSGANLWASLEIAGRALNKNRRIVTFVCDGAERYLSTELFK